MIVDSDQKPDVAQQNGQADPARGLTVPELARLLRVGEHTIRSWIRSGELGCVDTSDKKTGKRRFVILPHHLAAWERRNAAAEPPPTPKGRKRKPGKDWFADVED
jgi:excisionase family DNA binding protein